MGIGLVNGEGYSRHFTNPNPNPNPNSLIKPHHSPPISLRLAPQIVHTLQAFALLSSLNPLYNGRV